MAYLIEKEREIKSINSSWMDAGIKETLKQTRTAMGEFDTTYKNNTLTVIQSGKIRKYGFDERFDSLISFYKDIQLLPARYLYDEIIAYSDIYPKYCDFRYKGESKITIGLVDKLFSRDYALKLLYNLLKRLKNYIYTPEKKLVDISDINYEYRQKVLAALATDSILIDFIEKPVLIINDSEQVNPVILLKKLDIGYLLPPFYVPFHGKLYAQNILYSEENDTFILIYPRVSFGKSYIYGDYTMDLASLKQSFGGSYDMIRMGKFSLKQINNKFEFFITDNDLLDYLRPEFDKVVAALFDDDLLISRINLLEGILSLNNAILVSDKDQKMAYFLNATKLMNNSFCKHFSETLI